MKMGSIPELSTQTLLLFDLQIPVTKAKEDTWTLEKSISGMGLKIKSVEYGPSLRFKGRVIQNKLRNKMLLTLVKRRHDETAFSREISQKYVEFFAGKIINDPPETQTRERSNG